MNDFSLVCRVLGTLFYRQPQDEVLSPLLTLIAQNKLAEHWPLKQDALLTRMQQECVPETLQQDFQALFCGETPKVSPYRSAWLDADEQDIRAFLLARGMPCGEKPTDHFGALLLAGSWLEDQAQQDETEAQRQLFDGFLLTWSERFLGKVEANAGTGFYRALAILCREALPELRDELGCDVEQEG
ncbi:Cytoplasmic chaperone TorD family protein [Sodalis praecaptivus]|uniref:Cytoplasmic chaperone TorD family protein n=1 Tax=Sodalis praecaptivus TaxID=1239307 RepID=W0HWY5_9GAMM|nr:molecular chaperone [Sodalis praecaptivus]AHF76720.1 Cytoplasmic chaperone TorD family protein [Sodalis praecaptivus]